MGLEPTTRGLKGAGKASVEVHVRLTGLLISHAGVSKSEAVAVSAAVGSLLPSSLAPAINPRNGLAARLTIPPFFHLPVEAE